MPATIARLSAPVEKRSPSRKRQPEGGVLTGTKIVVGDLVQFDANGRVKQACAASANIGATTPIALFAGLSGGIDSPAATVTGVACEVEYLSDQDQMRMNLTNNGLTATWNVNLVGKQFEIRNVGGIYCVDINANTNKMVEIIGLDLNAPSSDAFPLVIVKFVSTLLLG